MTAHGLREVQFLLPPENWGCDAALFLRVCANACDLRKLTSPTLARTTMPMPTANGLWLPARQEQSHRVLRDQRPGVLGFPLGELHGGEPTANGRAAQATARALQPSECHRLSVQRGSAPLYEPLALLRPLATAVHFFLAF